MARRRLIPWVTLLVLVGEFVAHAHDPYEITSRAYLHSNRLELHIEMEFPAAMLLAGLNPARDPLAQPEQFTGALPALRTRAPDFFRITANGERLPVTSTNVSLEVENHVRFVLLLPATEPGTLGFAVGDLKSLSGHGPYGTSLTVVDMVREQVLGQSVLFGDSPPFQLVASDTAPTQLSNPPTVVHISATNLVASPETQFPTPPANRFPSWLALASVAAVLVLGLIVFGMRRRK